MSERPPKDDFPVLGKLVSQGSSDMFDHGIPVDSLDALVPPCMSVRTHVHAAAPVAPAFDRIPLTMCRRGRMAFVEDEMQKGNQG